MARIDYVLVSVTTWLPDLATKIYKPLRQIDHDNIRNLLFCNVKFARHDRCSCMLATSAGSLHLLPQTSRLCVQFGGRSSTVPVSKVRAHQRCQHHGYTGVLSNVLGEASKPRATTDRAHPARARYDPGHWDLSPEWWGTQAGGWGHDAGVPVFMQHSRYGNGQVRGCQCVRHIFAGASKHRP